MKNTTWYRRTSKEMVPNVPDPSALGFVLYLDPNPPVMPCNMGIWVTQRGLGRGEGAIQSPAEH